MLRMLATQALGVNQVWNYCNELSFKHWDRAREYLSAYDMQPYTKGAGKELGLHSQTVQAIQEEYATRRKQFKKVKLRWRVSGGAKRSLGWIPFKASAIKVKGDHIQFGGQLVKLWDSYGRANYTLGTGASARIAAAAGTSTSRSRLRPSQARHLVPSALTSGSRSS